MTKEQFEIQLRDYKSRMSESIKQQTHDAWVKFMETVGGFAYPHPTSMDSNIGIAESVGYPGATWIDVCAWHAMEGLLAYDGSEKWFLDKGHLTLQAKNCYRIAQAMLAEKQRIENE